MVAELFEFADGSQLTLAEIRAMAGRKVDLSVGSAPNAKTLTANIPYHYTSPLDTFIGGYPEETLDIHVDGLPDWLTFDAGTLTFNGVPDNGSTGDAIITVTASDRFGASVSTNFTLTINPIHIQSGTNGNDKIVGTLEADELIGLAGADNLIGGLGNDLMVGGYGNDTYVFGRGYGVDRVVEMDATAGNFDVAEFMPDIAADQLWFQRSGNDLTVSIIGSGDVLRIADWYSDTARQIEQFNTVDGKLTNDSVEKLVDAMAAFAPPAPGQLTLPTDYQAALASVLASYWL
ncbi:MAG: putative Ig domain-containing protein [Methylomonas sp.]|nr:putative Ig domain-containing protein [Methylomonas sp.]